MTWLTTTLLALVCASALLTPVLGDANGGGGSASLGVAKQRRLWRPQPASSLRRRAEQMKFSKLYNGLYYGHFEVGSPRQGFDVMVDTGSSDFWLNCKKGKTVTDRKFFYPEASRTIKNANKTTEIKYADGTRIVERWYKDVVIIDDKGTDVYFACAFEDENPDFSPADMAEGTSGLIGLAWPETSTVPYDPPFQAFLKAKKFASGVYGLYLGSDANSTDGELRLGSYNENLFKKNDLAWNPVPPEFNSTTPRHWNIYVDQLTVGKKTFAFKRGAAPSTAGTALFALDSGTSFYGFTSDIMAELIRVTNATDFSNNFDGGYGVDCKQRKIAPPLVFTIGGKKYTIEPHEWIGYDPDKIVIPGWTCYLQLYDLGDYYVQILGDPFLRKYYSIYDFDKKRTGLALAVPPKK
ncbi:aspartic peptidase domain-containing protein [Fimicolochytrium jonesii]|uniref:aspartic peptidase domain-containing protein n=1 Tax=Fimicolochytrium jonesii TaxID=1396493 RepID=UPI0022FEBB0D|nr:aspartic peptidase domain-containing protein [Fimicolochytrium jonesii]KAI8820120.1 aspartic peptidase domain-containing protein [Fimicolochytrium jonesii]